MSEKLSKTYVNKATELQQKAEKQMNAAYAAVYEKLALTYRRLAEQEENSHRKRAGVAEANDVAR